MALLSSFAQHAAIAIANAGLFHQEQARRQQLEALRRISEEITRELDLRTLLDLIIRHAVALVGGASGIVWLWEEAQQVLAPRAWVGLAGWMADLRFRLGEAVSGTVAERREGMIVNDVRTSPLASPAILERTGIAAVLAEPLLYRERLLGVIAVHHEEPGRVFSEQDRRMLALFAAQAAIALENARLHDATERRAGQLATLNRLAGALTRTLQPQQVADEILAAIQVLLPECAARLWGYRREDDVLSLIGGIGLQDPRGGVKVGFRLGEGLVGMA
jgi:GAF domain-containing protein